MCRYENCPLREARLEQGMTMVPVCAIPGLVTHHVFQPGERLACQAVPARYLYFLRKGYVKYTMLLADGREQILRLGAPSNVLGAEMIDEPSAPYSISALTRITTCRIRLNAMQRVLTKNPQASLKIVRFLGAEFQRLSAHIRGLGLLSAHERIAWFLLTLVPIGWCPGKRIRIPLPYKRDVAELLCLRAETLSRQLGRLKKLGLVEESGRRLYLQDVEKLRKLSGLSWTDAV